MGDFKVLHFKSSNADIYDSTKLTFFLKQPIILEEQYLLKTTNISFTKGEGESQVFVDENDLGVIFNSNYGFDLAATEGIWHYQVPNTDLTLVIEIFDPIFATRAARINDVIWGGGYNDPSVIFAATSANDFIEIPNMDVVRVSDGLEGWYKSISSGNLKIRINTIQTLLVETEIPFIKIYMDNLKFNTSSYISSCRNFSPIFDNITMDYKVLNSSYYGLVLEPQIISSITFIIEDIDKKPFKFNGVNINILNWTIMLKKKI
tara:strand:- start:962 stop:1747 length:786 start_codon:yes stop_codon:yes gene_type:complete